MSYQFNTDVAVTCQTTGAVILEVEMNLAGQTLAALLADASGQLAIILAELVALNPDCTMFSLEVSDPNAGIDYVVNSSSLLLLVSQAYTELVFVLVNL
jgi:hypothetical protein